jgi:hypothetical protein
MYAYKYRGSDNSHALSSNVTIQQMMKLVLKASQQYSNSKCAVYASAASLLLAYKQLYSL